MRLWNNAKQQPSPARYLGQRLRIGWGTARVAVSMALVKKEKGEKVIVSNFARKKKAQFVFAEIKGKKNASHQ